MNKKKILFRSFSILLGLNFLFHSQLIGQEEDDDLLDLGEVISIGNLNLTLKDAYKFSSNPVIRDSVLEITAIEFSVKPVKANTAFKVSPLKPANLKIVDPLPKYYRAYVLGGFGVYASPKAEFYFNSIRNRNWNYGFQADYFSGQGGIKDVPSSAWGNTNADLWATRYFKKSSLSLKGGYNNNYVHYYGGTENLDSVFTKDQIVQKINSGDIAMSMRSYFKDTSKVNYIVNARYKYLQDHYETVEHRGSIDGHILGTHLNQYYDLGYIVDYNNTKSISNSLGSDINDSLPINSQINTVVGLNPAVDLHGDKWKVLVGVNMYFDNTDFHFYPRAEAYYELFNKAIIPYLGVNGEIQKKTFGEFYKENPFVISSATIKNTNQKIYFYGGIRGKIANRISFDVNYSYETLENMPLYVNDTLYSAQNRFSIRYDKVTVNGIYGSIKYVQVDKLSVRLGGNFYSYQSTNELHAWQKPNMKIDLSIDYNLSDKFLIGLSFYFIGDRKAASLLPVEGVSPEQGIYVVDMASYVDANLNFEYRYTQRLSAFININNLFSSKYDKWYLYQVQPFFALIGASYSF